MGRRAAGNFFTAACLSSQRSERRSRGAKRSNSRGEAVENRGTANKRKVFSPLLASRESFTKMNSKRSGENRRGILQRVGQTERLARLSRRRRI